MKGSRRCSYRSSLLLWGVQFLLTKVSDGMADPFIFGKNERDNEQVSFPSLPSVFYSFFLFPSNFWCCLSRKLEKTKSAIQFWVFPYSVLFVNMGNNCCFMSTDENYF